MTLTELNEIPEPTGRRPVGPNELLVAGENFADFYSGGGIIDTVEGLAELIRQKFPEDAGEISAEVLAVARRQKRGEGFHPIADCEKQVVITENVHGVGGSLYLAVKSLP